MGKRRDTKPGIAVTLSSGNVFADLGLPEPEEELTKAQLASQLRHILKHRRLTQAAAAELMGIDQPKVSALVNGRLANFSSERLMRLLTALGHNVDIVVSVEPQARSQGCVRGRISVSSAKPGSYAIEEPASSASATGFSEEAADPRRSGKPGSARKGN
jgi:predicted XRE-type DNA-binding protein